MIIFNVYATNGQEPPCPTAVCMVPADEDNFEPGQWVVMFETLPELLAFVANNGPAIVRVGGNLTDHVTTYNNTNPTIEIYNSRRE